MSIFFDKHINNSSEKNKRIESLTRNHERRKRITASNFDAIIKRSPNIPMEQLLYTTFKGNALTKLGTQQERVTIHEYILKQAENGTNVEVKKSGFVICEDAKFLGGSPDGVV
ncbi:hypothetical protein ACF0H5_016846 [Mactra antiquata]